MSRHASPLARTAPATTPSPAARGLATVDLNTYPLAMMSDADLALTVEAIRENTDGRGISHRDLRRITWPSGGKIAAFAMPTAAGIDAPVGEFEGIIVYQRPIRLYFPDEFGSGNPPACYSDDALTGHGKPGGTCADCPLAQFGSAAEPGDAKPARKQACSERRLLMVVTRESNLLPMVLSVPAGSLGALRNYMVGRLLSLSPPATYWQVVTRFSLTPAKSEGGQDYFEGVFSPVGRLAGEQVAALKARIEQLRSIMALVRDTAPPDNAAAAAKAAGAP